MDVSNVQSSPHHLSLFYDKMGLEQMLIFFFFFFMGYSNIRVLLVCGIFFNSCCDQTKVTHTVYNRMALLLKSLITVSRVTPAYRLSRRQGADSYVICYR
jgi:hypothetical protein